MSNITPIIDEGKSSPLYMQIYEQIRDFILSGNLSYKEKLPSLRGLASKLQVSVSTVDLAYSQLLVEGYIISEVSKGYFVNYDIENQNTSTVFNQFKQTDKNTAFPNLFQSSNFNIPPDSLDTSSFDFTKWKKCVNKVLNYYPHLLLFESDPQGEEALRIEIAKYIHTSRGVNCNADQIFISAGTQQTTFHISNLLRNLNITNVSLEDPGYAPVEKIFSDTGFQIKKIPVGDSGVNIDYLPTNISCAIYVSPSNQFPTGSVMPISQRQRLLKWAQENSSFIIEDDYDSELRYFGRPIPPLQSLDSDNRVIYLGSFSSTLFPAIKISYMVVPKNLIYLFEDIKSSYSQTCSKTEQLALALFMEEGKYMQNIKKMRRSYSQKLSKVVSTIKNFDKDEKIIIKNSNSGITILLRIKTSIPAYILCEEAKLIGLTIVKSPENSSSSSYCDLIFYYNTLPMENINSLVSELLERWNKLI